MTLRVRGVLRRPDEELDQHVAGAGQTDATAYHSVDRVELAAGSFPSTSAALRPALVPDKASQITYVDGHMIAYWSRASRHKGTITMLGRIMAGSHAVIAHNEAGHALWVQYYPPDLHLSHVVVA